MKYMLKTLLCFYASQLQDIEFIEKRIEDVEKSMKRSNDKQLKIELELCLKVSCFISSRL